VSEDLTSVRRWAVVMVLFVFTVGVRWATLPRLLPQSWTPESEVIITARVLEQPTLNDTKYIIRFGKAVAYFSAPKRVEIGDYVRVIGRPMVRVIGGKQVSLVLYDPTISVIEPEDGRAMSYVENLLVRLVRLRQALVLVLEKNLPEPHASLSAGILMGVKSSMPEGFFQALVKTGTLHVVAASGYNVAIVLRVVMGVLWSAVGRAWGLVWGVVAVVVYVVIAGGSASIVRAGIMGIVTYGAFYSGRVASAGRILWITVWGMLIYDPLYLVDVGFQLSVAATAAMIYLVPWLETRKIMGVRFRKDSKYQLERYLADTLYPTLAAGISTLPILLWWFGRVSWISTIANVAVLWVVPIIMFLSAIMVVAGFAVPLLGKLGAWVLYLPLEYFVRAVEVMGG